MLKTSLKSVALLSLVAGIYGLTGCTVDDESNSDEEEVKEVVVNTEGEAHTITSNSTYDLIVSGDDNRIVLKDQINTITVSGAGNTIRITEDKTISEITVTGDRNYIDDDVIYAVSKVVVTGSNNIIETGSIGTTTNSGLENEISESAP